MIYDSNVLIYFTYKDKNAIFTIKNDVNRTISIVTYLEFLDGAGKHGIGEAMDFLAMFQVLAVSKKIQERAVSIMKKSIFRYGLRIGAMDAIVAATAVESSNRLCTENTAHFEAIKDKVQPFHPLVANTIAKKK
jgi:predicted nucleic acid-binding protein